MKRRGTIRVITSSAAVATAALAMSAAAVAAPSASVSIRFAAVNGSAPVSCATPIAGLGTSSATAALQDLRFYVSNVRLVRANGTSVPLKPAGSKAFNLVAKGNRTTLIDLENGKGACNQGDAATNAVIRGTVPKGRYVGARMYVGVPFPLNHTDITTAPAPLDLAAMAWSWQSGRKFMKVELADPAGAAGTWQTKAYMVHLGSTGCTGNPAAGGDVDCSASNRVPLRFARFNPATQKIAFDVGALVAGTDVTRNGGGAPGCMSGATDPECGPVFGHLGLHLAAQPGMGEDMPGMMHGMQAPSGQTVFRVVAR
ncbi:MAG: MbnP family copper-binding protein [Thermoleophilia bacterium]